MWVGLIAARQTRVIERQKEENEEENEVFLHV